MFKYIYIYISMKKKKIVIVNQPTKNRGDEAAHKSFVRALRNNFTESEIIVVFHGEEQGTINAMALKDSCVKYININKFKYGYVFIVRLCMLIHMPQLAIFHPVGFMYLKNLLFADYIICAPGGISMGRFKNWSHVFVLYLARWLRKKTAYYSRSFGPFEKSTYVDKLYYYYSNKILNGFDYLSIRDSITIRIAEDMNLSYNKSIDSVFLDCVNLSVPKEIISIIEGGKYIVFVPNSLTWHPFYKNVSQEKIDTFYLGLFNDIIGLGDYDKIIMLPQLFDNKLYGDEKYFQKLCAKIKRDEKIYVVAEKYSSDVQQAIIAASSFVIGARYHSIVFAINNKIPFVALSYEHKINGLLEMLGITERMVSIEGIVSEVFDNKKINKKILALIQDEYDTEAIKNKATLIAQKSMASLVKQVSKEIK